MNMLDLKRRDPVEHARILGAMQYNHGASRADNPYTDDRRREAWNDGWSEAWAQDD